MQIVTNYRVESCQSISCTTNGDVVFEKINFVFVGLAFYIRSHLKGQQTSSSLWMSFCINALSDCVQHIIYNWFWEKVYWDKDEYRTCNLFCLVHCFAFHKILNTISDNGTRMKKKCNSIIIMLVNQHLKHNTILSFLQNDRRKKFNSLFLKKKQFKDLTLE